MPRSRAELEAALVEQVTLLVSYCEQYDKGVLAFCKPMATAVRVLLHETGKSKSLMGQLQLRSGRFFTVCPPLNPRNLLTECGLLVFRFSHSGGEHLPRLHVPIGRQGRTPFPEWWVRPIAKGKGGKTMSRMDIICAVADTDGGSHVDAGLTEIYRSFRAGEFLGWMAALEGQPKQHIHSPQYSCVRTIAHELLLTLEKYKPQAFAAPYEFVPS